MSEKRMLVTGWRTKIIRKRMQWFIVAEAIKHFHNPLRALSEMKRLRDLRKKVHGSIIYKYIRGDNRYFWTPDYCGFPSESLKNLIHNEFKKNGVPKTGSTDHHHALQTLIWGITNRCPLSCQHCYEWDNISQRDKLDLTALRKILKTFKSNGLSHIQFSGGEPLVRFDDLINLIGEASPTMDCWLLTSGYGLTPDKAHSLKNAGLTGAHISLDHWDPQLHNIFRNNSKSYQMATDAIKNCLDAGILGSLSLCATREFVTEENLMKYADMAKQLGADFIRILEPRAVGRFSGKNVYLENSHAEILMDFASRLNANSSFKDFPIISFIGGYQRKIGCFGAGNRYVYVDPNGDVHACPFCRGRLGNMLQEPFDEIINKVRAIGCHLFENHC
jgi:MoaA/NifB/PqqE/SkfB family radical SAM enzyme